MRYKGICPFGGWQVDFTQVPRSTGDFTFVLVFADTFSGWVEVHPTRTEKETEEAKLVLKEWIPRFGLLAALKAAPFRNLPGDPSPWGRQKANRTMKQTLGNTRQETPLKRDQASLLPCSGLG